MGPYTAPSSFQRSWIGPGEVQEVLGKSRNLNSGVREKTTWRKSTAIISNYLSKRKNDDGRLLWQAHLFCSSGAPMIPQPPLSAHRSLLLLNLSACCQVPFHLTIYAIITSDWSKFLPTLLSWHMHFIFCFHLIIVTYLGSETSFTFHFCLQAAYKLSILGTSKPEYLHNCFLCCFPLVHIISYFHKVSLTNTAGIITALRRGQEISIKAKTAKHKCQADAHCLLVISPWIPL